MKHAGRWWGRAVPWATTNSKAAVAPLMAATTIVEVMVASGDAGNAAAQPLQFSAARSRPLPVVPGVVAEGTWGAMMCDSTTPRAENNPNPTTVA